MESFALKLHKRRIRNEEGKVLSIQAKDGRFPAKRLYSVLGKGRNVDFPSKVFGIFRSHQK